MAGGALTWSEIYDRTTIKLGPFSRSNLTYLLDNLVRYGYLERLENGSFAIPDPVVRYMAARLK